MPVNSSNTNVQKLISVVIPTYNEEKNVQDAYLSVRHIFENALSGYEFEIIFTDNHSEDNTFSELERIAQSDSRVKVARFTKNVGFNKSILTGYRLSRGDAAIQLDCDLQDPPELFPKFIELWEQGHDVVVGLRQQRPEARWLLALRKSFYRFLAKISPDNIVIDGGDFRLVDRSVLNQLRQIHDASPYVRGLISSLASNQIGFDYLRRERKVGVSKFPLSKLVGLAIDGIINHSTLPLRLATLFGAFIGVAALILAFVYLTLRLFFDFGMPGGFATNVILELLSISVNAIFLGIIGEYLARIHQQIRNRPIAAIHDSRNLLPEDTALILPPDMQNSKLIVHGRSEKTGENDCPSDTSEVTSKNVPS